MQSIQLFFFWGAYSTPASTEVDAKKVPFSVLFVFVLNMFSVRRLLLSPPVVQSIQLSARMAHYAPLRDNRILLQVFGVKENCFFGKLVSDQKILRF